MKTFKGTLFWVGLMLAACGQCLAAEWLTDASAAMNKARREDKAVLLDFTGSDWCGWCMKLKSEVFDQPEFAAFAQANLVLVEVDFPRGKKLNADEKVQNDRLARKYGIRGYPSIVVLNSAGEEIGQAGYQAGGPKAFIQTLSKMPGLRVSAKPGRSARGSGPDAPNKPASEVAPIAPALPIRYGELALKAISGPVNGRVALINNETFYIGDTAKVKVKDTKVQVTCKEIREDSVLLSVDGKTMELKLAHH